MMIIITNTIAVMIIVSGTTLSKVRAARLHGIIWREKKYQTVPHFQVCRHSNLTILVCSFPARKN